MFKSAASFSRSRALKSVLNVLTLKVPTLTRRCFLHLTTLRLATDSDDLLSSVLVPSNLSCFSTSHTMTSHVCL